MVRELVPLLVILRAMYEGLKLLVDLTKHVKSKSYQVASLEVKN
jgi:hypothetical protein